jgi:hypothetical protein
MTAGKLYYVNFISYLLPNRCTFLLRVYIQYLLLLKLSILECHYLWMSLICDLWPWSWPFTLIFAENNKDWLVMDVVSMFRGNNCSSGFIAHLFRHCGKTCAFSIQLPIRKLYNEVTVRQRTVQYSLLIYVTKTTCCSKVDPKQKKQE